MKWRVVGVFTCALLTWSGCGGGDKGDFDTVEPKDSDQEDFELPDVGGFSEVSTDNEVVGEESDADPGLPDALEKPTDPTCEQFCPYVLALCGTEAGYATETDCASFCAAAALPAGQIKAADLDNTIGCRIEQAEVECTSASAFGGAVCGTWCENYCQTLAAICPGASTDCPADCKSMLPEGGEGPGDALSCRFEQLYLAGLAQDHEKDALCVEASPASGDACAEPPQIPTCGEYCAEMVSACPDEYGSEQHCNAWCSSFAAIDAGVVGDIDKNTVGCRMTALLDGDCAGAGPTAGGECGETCELYCVALANGCAGDASGCTTACDAMSTEAAECRLEQLVAASDPAADEAAGCLAGAPGSCQCDAPPSCEDYCSTVLANCEGSFDTQLGCEQFCSKLPKSGSACSDSTNTVECRHLYAKLAALDATNCGAAGASGGDVCGQTCEVVCDLVETSCGETAALGCTEDCQAWTVEQADCLLTDASTDTCQPADCEPPPGCTEYCSVMAETCGDVFDDPAACLATCAILPAGLPDEYSFECHLAAAEAGDCAAADPQSPGCGELCDAYCTATQALCSAEPACVTECDALTIGELGDAAGDTLYCRLNAAWAGDCESATLAPSGQCVEPPPTCNNYCSEMAAACPSAYEDGACQTLCAKLGEAALPCHLAALAEGSCEEAHLLSGACSELCTTYCSLVVPGCDAFATDEQPQDACEFACSQVSTIGASSSQTGDSLYCKINAAASEPPDCLSASLDPAGQCQDIVVLPDPSCEDYCAAVDAACPALYPDASCLSFCLAVGWPLGSIEDESGATLGCHQSFAVAAAETPELCVAAGPDGGNACGDVCDNYCDALEALCGAPDGCVQSCESLQETGLVGQTEGDTVQCRLTWLVDGSCENGGLESAACEPPDSTGEACEAPLVITSGDLPLSSSTVGKTDDGGPLGDACPAGTGTDAPDVFYQFVAESTGVHLITLTGDFDAALYVSGGCDQAAEVCGLAGAGPLYVPLTQGQARVLAVDGQTSGAQGNFTLDITLCAKTCAPTAQCGDDGCGGVCGTCSDGFACFQGSCLVGDGCAAPLPVGLDLPAEANTSEYGDSLTLSEFCPQASGPDGASDVVFAFEPPFDGQFDLVVNTANGTAVSLGWSDNCDVALSASCGGTTTGATMTQGSTWFIPVELAPPGPLTLTIVDVTPPATCPEYCQGVHAGCVGQYTQFATNQECLSYCEEAAAWPAGDHLDTAVNTISCRAHYGALISEQDEASQVAYCHVAGQSGGDVCGSWCTNYCQLMLKNCAGEFDDQASCEAACSAMNATGDANAFAGDTLQCRLYQAGQAGLDEGVSCEAAGISGGLVCYDPPSEADTCDEAAPVLLVPFEGETSTTNAADDYSSTAEACAGPPGGEGAGDTVFKLVAPQTAIYRASLTPSGYDARLIVSADCLTLPDSCVATIDSPGVNAIDSFDFVMTKGQQLYFIADGASSQDTGTATLSLTNVGTNPNCEALCKAVNLACSDNVYGTTADCLDTCSTWAAWSAGTLTDETDNTIGCRLHHAQAALPSGDAAPCDAAGPFGAATCGTWCHNYCSLALKNCPGSYADAGECADACDQFDQEGEAGADSGDSVQCRLTYALLAGKATGAQALHCAAAAAISDGTCGGLEPPDCDTYCSVVGSFCVGPNVQFADEAQCLSLCAQWPAGTLKDTNGNTIGCRQNFAQLVSDGALLPGVGCNTAGPSGGSSCGEPCETFCQAIDTLCPDTYGPGSCPGICSGFSQEGTLADQGGDTVMCRFGAAINGDCLAAAPNGGDVCVQPPPPGDVCGDALVVDALPFAASGDTTDATDVYSFDDTDNCSGSIGGAGGAGFGDITFRYQAEGPVTLRAHLANNFNALLYAVADNCDNISAGCLAASDAVGNAAETITLQLEAGAVVYFIVDGSAGGSGAGTYALTVTPLDPSCGAWCDISAESCPDLFSTAAACKAYCNFFGKPPAGSAGDQTGNSVACRQWHAIRALEGETGACAGAAADGGGSCGSWCDNYCALAGLNCPSLYPEGGCSEACGGMSDNGDSGSLEGDSVQCRITHLGLAGDPLEGPLLHCPAADLSGGGFCGLAPGEGCALPLDVAFPSTVQANFAGDAANDFSSGCDSVDGPEHVYSLSVAGDVKLRASIVGLDTAVVAAFAGTCSEPECLGKPGQSTLLDLASGSTTRFVVEAPNATAGSYSLVLAEAQATCAEYCDAMDTGCPGQYADPSTCLALCTAAIPVGPWTSLEHTTGCRTQHAENDLCGAAGITGGGVCGTRCDSYCALALTTCSGLYADESSCHTACSSFPKAASDAAVKGNSVQCRTNQILAGACAAGAADGGGVCTTPPTCDAYCALMETVCGGTYADEAACLDWCGPVAALPAGLELDTSGNTLGCRIHQAETALEDPVNASAWCLAAGPVGAGICGTRCENICHVANKNCAGEWPADCATACEALQLPDGAPDALSSDTLSCRMNHAGLAYDPLTGGSGVHCPAASPTGGNICTDLVPDAGDSCATAQLVSLPGELTTLGSTNTQTNRYGFAAGFQCAAAGGGAGSEAPDEVYTFGHETKVLTVTASLFPVAFDGLMYVLTDCSAPTTSCQLVADAAGIDGEETLSFATVPGVTYFLVVDGVGGQKGDYLLTVNGQEKPSCDLYCSAMAQGCPDAYKNVPCLPYCQEWAELPEGSAGATSGNSLGCRIYFAQNAVDDPQSAGAWCPGAGKTGGDTCGSWCDNYCHLSLKNCPGEYADSATCLDACASMSADGAAADITGDTVQCRLEWGGHAGNPNGEPAEACAAAAQDGGTQCVDPLPTCADYCSTVMANCTGQHAQYDSLGACSTYCLLGGKLPAGSANDSSTNTVGCRIKAASAASQDPAANCPAAGPSGGDVCGSWCDNYCHLAVPYCDEFATMAECQASCAAFDSSGEPNDSVGDTVQCRLTAAVSAATGEQGHCDNASAAGGVLCVPPVPQCAEYCDTVMANCSEDNAQYADKPACLAYCETYGALPSGAFDDIDGNSIGCRLSYAQAASTTPSDCNAAGPAGDNVCGSWCDNYCHLAINNCGIYASTGQCLAACATMPQSGSVGATSGDSVQCRLQHVALAGDPAQDLPAQCAAGAESGGTECVDPKPTCIDYCVAMTTDCPGEYLDGAACLTWCAEAKPPAGDFGDDAGHSLGCRITWSDGAAGDAALCTAAGPTGGDICGSWCDNYCQQQAFLCPGLYGPGECEGACAIFAIDGDVNDETGDSVQCRLTQLETAAFLGDDPWCGNAAPDGNNVCVAPPSCEAYCASVTENCTGPDAQYDSEQACVDYCTTSAALPVGSPGDAGTNSVGCRQTQADDSATDSTSCLAAGPTGDDNCGSFCENYCHLMVTAANCAAAYADVTTCLTTCDGFGDDGQPGALKGDSINCRMTWAGLAGGANPTGDECAKAAGASTVCVDVDPGAINLSGWKIVQTAEAVEFAFPPGTVVESNQIVLVVRNAEKAAFEAYWFVTLNSNVRYFNTANSFPKVDGGETFVLQDAAQTAVDGPTVAMEAASNYNRVDGTTAPGDAGSWAKNSDGPADLFATPGAAPGEVKNGIFISEMSDAAANEGMEYVELFVDTSTGGENVTYTADIQPIFASWCGSCHSGNGPDDPNCSGGKCLATSYAATQLLASACQGSTVAECAMMRIGDGEMPQDCPFCLDPTQIQLIEQWVGAGAPE